VVSVPVVPVAVVTGLVVPVLVVAVVVVLLFLRRAVVPRVRILDRMRRRSGFGRGGARLSGGEHQAGERCEREKRAACPARKDRHAGQLSLSGDAGATR